MYDPIAPELLKAASVLLLAVAAEDGNVDPREVNSAGEAIAQWGRCDRVTAAQTVQSSFQELGEIWNLGGHAELDRHVWEHAGVLVDHLTWHPLHALTKLLTQVAGADGKLDRAEEGLVEALASYFDREAGPPAEMSAIDLLERFDAESRGDRWLERFKDKIRLVHLEIGDPENPATGNPRTYQGPGGFQLAEARIRPIGGHEVPFSELVRWCTDEGLGLHIEPEWSDPPGHVFRYGELWSYRAFDGSFDGPQQLGREPHLDEVLPHWAREYMARLFQSYGLPGRQVVLLTSPAGEPTLAFDAPAHFLPEPSLHAALERTLRWVAPPRVVLLTVDPSQHPDYPWEAL